MTTTDANVRSYESMGYGDVAKVCPQRSETPMGDTGYNTQTLDHRLKQLLSYESMGYGDVALVCPQRSETIEDMGYEDMGMGCPPQRSESPPPSYNDMGYGDMAMDSSPKRQHGYSSPTKSVTFLGSVTNSKRRGSLTFSNEINALPRAVRRFSNLSNSTDSNAIQPRRLCRRASISN
jgi:hypothetical protein